jgi:hypothetical protein
MWGFSTAHWDGDVLVVDSNGFDPRTCVDHFGYPHTDKVHLQERYHRTNCNTVELSMTITDPTKRESGGGVFALALVTGQNHRRRNPLHQFRLLAHSLHTG